MGSVRAGEGERVKLRPLVVLSLAALSLAAVPGDDEGEAAEALLAAREAFEDRKLKKAIKKLRTLDNTGLEAHARLIEARWQLAEGKAEAATESARVGLSKNPPSEVRARLLMAQAAAALAENNLSDSYAASERAWKASRNPETAARIAFELAQEFEARSLPGNALKLYRWVWERWPSSMPSGQAFERSLFLMAGTGAPPPEIDAMLSYAAGLKKRYKCDVALGVFADVLKREDLSPARRTDAQQGHADCLFQRRRYDEARDAYLEMAQRQPESLEPRILAARSLARVGKSTRALEEFNALREQGNAAHRARLDYLRAIVLRTSNPSRYREILTQLEKQRSSPRLALRARWHLAREDLVNERYANALSRLKKMTAGSLWDIEIQRARYWYAVARLKTGDATGEPGLRELAEKVPLSFYGLMAADRLGLDPDYDAPFVRTRMSAGPFEPVQRAGALIEAGFSDIAHAELESWHRARQLTRAERLAAAPLLHEVGDHFRATRLLIDGFGGTFERGIDPTWRAAWEHAWPRPFPELVSSAVAEFGFDRALVYAVMREESTYRPKVESPAGALGLMQIIPPTGTRIANDLGVDPFEPTALFSPETNIRFGTYYLDHLMKRFEGSRPRAIAAYNAGPHAVNSWIERDGDLPLDAFVDSIPYNETRRYLRKVYRSWRVYRMLYADDSDAPQPKLAQPRESLSR